MNLFAALLALAIIGYVVKIAISSRGFSLTRAMQPAESFTGEAVGRLLAIVSVITTIVDTKVIPLDYLARFGAQAVALAAIGLAIAPIVTDRIIAIAAVVLEIAGIGHQDGPQAAVSIFIIALLAVWLMGAVRGFGRG